MTSCVTKISYKQGIIKESSLIKTKKLQVISKITMTIIKTDE